MDPYRVIEVKQSVFADNDKDAEALRRELKEQGTFLVNLMSSPGSGKTTTLTKLLKALPQDMKVGIMEADIDSDVDAGTIAATGTKVIQLHTGGMCHLDADMTRQGVRQLGNSFRSHKVDLDLCRPEQLLKCFVSSLRSHGFGRFAGAVAGKRSRFAGECGLVGLRNGVLPLLVDFRINAVQQVGLLNAELGFVECTVCHIRLKNAAQQDLGEFRKDSFVFQSIAVSNGRSPQGDDLYITHFGNAAAEICPVQHVQFAVHDRVGGIGFAAGNHKAPGEGAGSGSLFRQRLQKLDAQVIGL